MVIKVEKSAKHSRKPKRGFTDRLYFLNLILAWAFIILCLVLTIFSGYLNVTDLSVISYGIPAVFAELGIHTGFIIWKAKAENISKYGGNINELGD